MLCYPFVRAQWSVRVSWDQTELLQNSYFRRNYFPGAKFPTARKFKQGGSQNHPATICRLTQRAIWYCHLRQQFCSWGAFDKGKQCNYRCSPTKRSVREVLIFTDEHQYVDWFKSVQLRYSSETTLVCVSYVPLVPKSLVLKALRLVHRWKRCMWRGSRTCWQHPRVVPTLATDVRKSRRVRC